MKEYKVGDKVYCKGKVGIVTRAIHGHAIWFEGCKGACDHFPMELLDQAWERQCNVKKEIDTHLGKINVARPSEDDFANQCSQVAISPYQCHSMACLCFECVFKRKSGGI